MHDPLSEDEACDLLASVFRGRGYAVKRNVMFKEEGVEFRVDGWDAKARVGFEFLSSEADDHHDLTLGEFKRVMAAQQRGDLALFVIDEAEQLTASDLAAAAVEFLDEVEAVRPRRRAAPRSVKRARKKPAPRGKAAAAKRRTPSPRTRR